MRSDRDLDRELRDLAPHVEYPPTPDLTRSVRDRLEGENSAGIDAPTRTGPQLWWVAAAALLLLVALPTLAVVVTTMGNSLSGGAGGGAAVEGGGGPGQRGTAGVAEPTQPPPAKESGASSGSSSAAACFTPEAVLEARPPRGTPGDEFRIGGEHFDGNLRDCDDDPARDVRVEFLQDGRTWELGRLVSDKGSRLAASLEVPADARPGRATVRATFGQGPPEEPYGRQSAEVRFLVVEGETAPADK